MFYWSSNRFNGDGNNAGRVRGWNVKPAPPPGWAARTANFELLWKSYIRKVSSWTVVIVSFPSELLLKIFTNAAILSYGKISFI